MAETKGTSERKKKGKPFWKSKGFWGGVLSVGSAVAPFPLRPVIAVVGGALGIYGRTVATEPLTFPKPKLPEE